MTLCFIWNATNFSTRPRISINQTSHDIYIYYLPLIRTDYFTSFVRLIPLLICLSINVYSVRQHQHLYVTINVC